MCKKIKQFSGCLETKVYQHCNGFDYSQPDNERLCFGKLFIVVTGILIDFEDLGCCFDPSKSRKCFRPNTDGVDSGAQPSTSHTPGFAAGITALVCILIYGVSFKQSKQVRLRVYFSDWCCVLFYAPMIYKMYKTL